MPRHRSRAGRFRRSACLGLLALLAAPITAGGPRPAGAQAMLPPDFVDQLVAAVAKPTGVAPTPDGRLLVATQPGLLRVVTGGTLLAAPALDLGPRLCSTSERGLLGVAVDPGFAVNRRFFVFYTDRNGSDCGRNLDPYPVNRVSRFTLPDSNVVDPASEVVILDHIPSRTGQHNGGDLHIGADGLLYVSVGDGMCRLPPADDSRCAGDNDNARSLSHLLGKILRVDPEDGSVPPGNPFASAPGARRCGDPAGPLPGGTGPCRETFASGLRNPFRFAIRPGTSELYINDVGQDTWEEVNAGVAGGDYGWNVREGHCARGSTTDCGDPGAGFVNPLFDYGQAGGCSSITGAVFVPPGVWPAPYDGAYLFADYVCGTIFRLVPAPGGAFTATAFVTGLGASSATSLTFGGYGGGQALYYSSYAGGGELRRIVWAPPGLRPPLASFSAVVPAGTPPVTVSFDAGTSSDPDGGTLTYRWDFGDGVTEQTAAATTTHRYQAAGTFVATLTVVDPDALESAPATRSIGVGLPNGAPTPVVVSPTTTDRFRVGQTITLRGAATDPEDGSLPDDALTWEVVYHHDNHTHPLLPATAGNNISFAGPPPENLAAVTNSYLEIHLTATDSGSRSASVVQRFDARKVTLTFKTSPDHLDLVVGGTAVTATTKLKSWAGYQVTISAPGPQTLNGVTYAFARWSDGKAATHTITTPPSATTYKAVYRMQ